ncbi:hypothetical protein M997_2542 [Proteus hauseri ATCC 700826]|uniref:Uncharacterized protein n=1 Tax=Proteus hauseri ATCC 700826 TaxID=1354271 RepID=A0AAJ3HRW6_PROHU|nr:hypothetical protein M997_2542 [Proteus hauseri ATCC 700826]
MAELSRLKRFIPVYTGNTDEAKRLFGGRPVYPRVYGEHITGVINVLVSIGLSPCIRGTHYPLLECHEHVRFIPVYTGNTVVSLSQSVNHQVYPRVYGEHIILLHDVVVFFGLSPCIRGTHIPQHFMMVLVRFIPVYTGNTHHQALKPIKPTVYPRVYGEHPPDKRQRDLDNGLSPCIRGTLIIYVKKLVSMRFIPVYTGNTLNISD